MVVGGCGDHAVAVEVVVDGEDEVDCRVWEGVEGDGFAHCWRLFWGCA